MKYLYRTVNVILAASIFPAAIFLDFVLVRASPTFLKAGIEEVFSIKRLIDMFTDGDSFLKILPGDGPFVWPKALDPIKGALAGFAVCFVLALAAALFIAIWSLFSGKRLPVLAASAAGLAATIIMILFFKSASVKITSGEINVAAALGSGFLTSLLGKIVEINAFALAGFQNAMAIVFSCLIAWTATFYLIEIGDGGGRNRTNSSEKRVKGKKARGRKNEAKN